jgi:CRISPR-associated exonuclease Cas4
LYIQGIRPERENQNVQIGKTLSETTYPRKKHEIQLEDFGVLDSAVLKNGEIQETKKSSKRKDLDEIQTAAYLMWLKEKNIKVEKAKIHYPLERKTTEIKLTKELKQKIASLENLWNEIVKKDNPPEIKIIKACEKCAYNSYCLD